MIISRIYIFIRKFKWRIHCFHPVIWLKIRFSFSRKFQFILKAEQNQKNRQFSFSNSRAVKNWINGKMFNKLEKKNDIDTHIYVCVCVPSNKFSMIFHGSSARMVSAGVRSVKPKKKSRKKRKYPKVSRKEKKNTQTHWDSLNANSYEEREPTISSSVESKVGQRA